MKMQLEEQKRLKRKHWIRLIIVAIAILLFAAGAIIWILNIGRVIQGNWSYILPVIFVVLGVLFTFLQWLLPISIETHHHRSSSTQHISPATDNAPNTTTQQPSIDESKIIQRQEILAPGFQQITQVQSKFRPNPVFHFNEPLTDSSEFFGRALERTTLISRTHQRASTSIVGPRRIGKTWLISYLRLVAPTELGSNFHIGYLDATSSKCSTVAGFTSKALEVLGFLPDTGLDKLGRAVENMISSKQTPVLCIDEFEGFISNQQEFNLNFFERLRAMTQEGLVLVTVSKKPLIDIMVDIVGESSPFFNIFEQRKLRPFNVIEAKSFVQAKGRQAGFPDKECSYFLDSAQEGEQQWPPLRLQLVGKLLLEDKIAAQTDPDSYLPDTQRYWRDFEKRVNETYEAVVRH